MSYSITRTDADLTALPDRLASAVTSLMDEGEAVNTRSSYAAALRYWACWHSLRYSQPISLPVPVPTVLQFIVDHVQRQGDHGELVHELPPPVDDELVQLGVKGKPGPMALNTVRHRLSVLSKAHVLKSMASPCQAPEVRALMSRIVRAYAKRGYRPNSKEALAREPLEALLATCDDSLKGKHDRALLLFAFSSGGRRRSEVTQATLENTRRVAPLTWVYTMGASKTNQTGEIRPEDQKPIVGKAAEALEAWLAASNITSGAIFRRLPKGTTVGQPLLPAGVRKIVQQRCAMAGLEGNFSAHSLRSGFVTEAGRQNIPLGDTMAMTGHTSIATVMRYFKSGSQLAGPAARLMEPDDKP